MTENMIKAMVEFEKSLVCVKACVFKKNMSSGHFKYATVLCCVPQNDYGQEGLYFLKNGEKLPESSGTFIRTIGNNLMNPAYTETLSRYERYLEKEGWEFAFTVKKARGKPTKEAFEICRTTISVARGLVR